MKPALTRKEWENHKLGVERGDCLISLHKMYPHRAILIENEFNEGDWVHQEGLQALAALCLHNQEFGFTKEDVEVLRDAQYCLENDRGPGGFSHIKRIADRIEALLPPEEEPK